MAAYRVRFLDADGDQQVSEFDSAAAAWRFMRFCDLHGVPAGYPAGIRKGDRQC